MDVRVRWRAGRIALAGAALLTLVALARPLAPPAGRPIVRLAVTVALGLGVAASAFLASLRGRGRSETFALYAFVVLALDALGQLGSPLGWPVWPAIAVLVAATAVADSLPVALGVAALASLLAVADAAWAAFEPWRQALAASAGYGALAVAVNRALLGEKRRLERTQEELRRVKYGIEQLDAPSAPTDQKDALVVLRQVSEEGRRTRLAERAEELDAALGKLTALARRAVSAHAVLHFEVDRDRELAFVRAADGPESLVRDCTMPLSGDPFGFVLERGTSFYATDFKRLLWSLPYYRGEVKVGSLVAIPIKTAGIVAGVLVADQIETQAFTRGEPEILEALADLAADALHRARTSQSLENFGAMFEAVHSGSGSLAAQNDAAAVRRILLRCAKELVPFEAAVVAVMDEAQTRYVLQTAAGWALEYEGREVGLTERTWTAWVLRSGPEGPRPFLLGDLAVERERNPVLVLDEGGGRAESVLIVTLRERDSVLGALVLTGRRGSFDATTGKVLELLCNQAAAELSTLRLLEHNKEMAVKDGLTALHNRRSFAEQLSKEIKRRDREGGTFALVLLDLDHFKKLNDTYGHPAGDEALRHAARTLRRKLREGDLAARYGGEEFVLILPGTEESGARQLAERVRHALESEPVVFEDAKIALTASLGVAVWPANGKNPEALIGAADRALYAAKQSGRNRVVTASTLPEEDGTPA